MFHSTIHGYHDEKSDNSDEVAPLLEIKTTQPVSTLHADNITHSQIYKLYNIIKREPRSVHNTINDYLDEKSINSDEAAPLLEQQPMEPVFKANTKTLAVINKIEEMAIEEPLRARVLLQSIKYKFTSSAQYEKFENKIHECLRLRYTSSIPNSKIYNSLQENFFQSLDYHMTDLPLDIWGIVLDYCQSFSLLRNHQGEFYKNPIIINTPVFLPAVSERDEAIKVLDDETVITSGITRENLEEKSISVPLVSHLIQRTSLDKDWYLLETSKPELSEYKKVSEEKRALITNSQKIYLALEQGIKTNLSINLSNALTTAKKHDLPFINLHHILHQETPIWQQQIAREPLYRRDLTYATASLFKTFNQATEWLAFLTLNNKIEHRFVALLTMPGRIGISYLTTEELLASPLMMSWRRNKPLTALVFSMLILTLLSLLQNYAPISHVLFCHKLGGSRVVSCERTGSAYFVAVLEIIYEYICGSIDAALLYLFVNQLKHLSSFSEPKKFISNITQMLPFMLPAAIMQARVFPMRVQHFEFGRTFELSHEAAIFLSLLRSFIKLVPAMIASAQALQETKALITNEPVRCVMEESQWKGCVRYTLAGMAILYCAITASNNDDPIFGLIAALAMLNECFLPKAIRTAHLPQRLFPAPKPVIANDNSEAIEIKIDEVNRARII